MKKGAQCAHGGFVIIPAPPRHDRLNKSQAEEDPSKISLSLSTKSC